MAPKSTTQKSVKRYPLKDPDAKCNGRKTGDRGYCKQDAGANTWHTGIGRCSRHGGSAPNYTAQVYKLRAEQGARKYSLPVKMDPKDALIGELERTIGVVQFLEFKVNELTHEGKDSNMVGPVGGGQGGYPEFKQNVYWGMWQQERKHLESVAKTCIAAGIEERRVKLAEDQGALIARVLQAVLADLGIKKDKEVPALVRKHLTLVQGGLASEAA